MASSFRGDFTRLMDRARVYDAVVAKGAAGFTIRPDPALSGPSFVYEPEEGVLFLSPREFAAARAHQESKRKRGV